MTICKSWIYVLLKIWKLEWFIWNVFMKLKTKCNNIYYDMLSAINAVIRENKYGTVKLKTSFLITKTLQRLCMWIITYLSKVFIYLNILFSKCQVGNWNQEFK